MALQAKVVTFLAVDGIVGTTQAITGVGFQPKAILFWTFGSNSAGNQTTNAQDARCSFGFAASPTLRGCTAWFIADNVATMDTSQATRADCCICSVAGAAITGRWDLQSFDSDGFTLIVDQDPPAGDNRRIVALCLGGTDIVNATTGQWNTPGATGNQDITGLGFQPDIVFFIADGEDGPLPVAHTFAAWCLGVAKSAAEQAVGWGEAQDASANSITSRYARYDECLLFYDDTLSQHRATFVSMLSDGFRVNWLASPQAGQPIQYLAIKGGSYRIGNGLTATSLTTVVTSGYGFAPKAVLVSSPLATAVSAAGTPNANLNWSIGAADSPTSRAAHATNEQNGQATSDVWFSQLLDAIYSNISAGAGVVGIMDVQSFDSDGVTFVMDDADPTQRVFGYLGIGDSPAGGPPGPNALMLLGVGQ